eukprot:CAMPEP_0182486544 /NCGR_PEP_ID=MMETSP1319-20130603/47262_1 /TAXON_ID=172717 /ORGANISM="Bolidomonas pacifica, Strain RCC208" /LENGTH=116 /DNA_ID=CAMNT_0024688633 /DNA_START=326 /DNA_END=676 /DNA_ORIENTATION=+
MATPELSTLCRSSSLNHVSWSLLRLVAASADPRRKSSDLLSPTFAQIRRSSSATTTLAVVPGDHVTPFPSAASKAAESLDSATDGDLLSSNIRGNVAEQKWEQASPACPSNTPQQV